MGVLDGFDATWRNARQTFGVGPVRADFDQGSALRVLESGLAAAAPQARWTGAAARNYAAATTEHRRVIGALADLDERLRTHIDDCAAVVATGRRELDAVRHWVTDAAHSVPAGRLHERLLLAIAYRGTALVGEIVTRCHSELGAIGDAIRANTREYQAVGERQKFGNR